MGDTTVRYFTQSIDEKLWVWINPVVVPALWFLLKQEGKGCVNVKGTATYRYTSTHTRT